MKHIPNILTISRIFLSALLPFTLMHTWIFISIFLLCGISDVLDGYLARRMKINSTFGARLDSVADFFLFIMMMFCTFITVGDNIRKFYAALAAIIVIRLFSLLIAAYKYHNFLILHTWGNKITGGLIYVTVICYLLSKWESLIFFALIIAMISAVEELLIHITSDKPDPDRKGLFWK